MRRRQPQRRGLTLIEVTIGLAIIGMVLGVAMVSVNALAVNQLRSTSIQIAGAIKESYDRSIMEKRIQRLVFDLDEHAWWVEFTEDPYALDVEVLAEADDPEEPEELYLDEDAPAELRAALEGNLSAGFKPDERFGKPKLLPGSVHFGRIWTGLRDDPFEKGRIYLHFFRGGFTEPMQLELYDGSPEDREDSRDYVTLKVRPLTGRVRMYQKQLEEPDSSTRPWEEDD